jgi:hypothetical protein
MPTSMSSTWVAMEVATTLYTDISANERELIPILPESTDNIRPALRRLNIIDLTNHGTRVDRYHFLLRSLNIEEKDLPSPSDTDSPLESTNLVAGELKTQKGHLLEGRPDLRERFENTLVDASRGKIDSFTAMEVLALRIGDRRTIYPSCFGEYPRVLWSFIKGDGTFESEKITPLVVESLIATLKDVVFAFYREYLHDIAMSMLESLQLEMSSVTRQHYPHVLKMDLLNELSRLLRKKY